MRGEMDLGPVPPQHEDVSPLRAKIAAEVQELPVGAVRRVGVGSHVGVEQLHANAVARLIVKCLQRTPKIAGHALVGIEAKHPLIAKLGAGDLQKKSAVTALGKLSRLDVLLPGAVGDDERDL